MSLMYPQDLLAKRNLERKAVQKNWDVYDIGDHPKKTLGLAWSCPLHASPRPPHCPRLLFAGHPRENETEASQKRPEEEMSPMT